MTYPPDPTSGEGFEEEAAVEDLSHVHDDDLETSIVELKRHIDAARARLALRIAEYDQRGLARERHVLTTKQWLAHRTRMTKSAASTILRTGRALAAMPTVAPAAQAGVITAGGVRLLAAASLRHPEAFANHEEVLGDVATYLDPKDLRIAVRHWEQQVAYPDVATEVAAMRRRRRLSVNQTLDGMWAVSGELDPESGHVVSTAIRAMSNPANLDPDDGRTHPQRSADAVVDMCRFALDHDPDISASGGHRPHITVEVPWHILTSGRDDDRTLDSIGGSGRRFPEVDGEPVSRKTIRRLSCDAGIVRMVTGPDSEVLDVGRSTRTIPSATRRALERRDGGCAWAGCDADVSWCDAHHRIHWADGGPTDLDNLDLLCRTHHTAVHDGRPIPRSQRRSSHDPPES